MALNTSVENKNFKSLCLFLAKVRYTNLFKTFLLEKYDLKHISSKEFRISEPIYILYRILNLMQKIPS